MRRVDGNGVPESSSVRSREHRRAPYLSQAGSGPLFSWCSSRPPVPSTRSYPPRWRHWRPSAIGTRWFEHHLSHGQQLGRKARRVCATPLKQDRGAAGESDPHLLPRRRVGRWQQRARGCRPVARYGNGVGGRERRVPCGERVARAGSRRKRMSVPVCRRSLRSIATAIPYSQAVRLHQALDKAGVSNQLLTIPRSQHGLFNLGETLRVCAVAQAFLTRHGLMKGAGS